MSTGKVGKTSGVQSLKARWEEQASNNAQSTRSGTQHRFVSPELKIIGGAPQSIVDHMGSLPGNPPPSIKAVVPFNRIGSTVPAQQEMSGMWPLRGAESARGAQKPDAKAQPAESRICELVARIKLLSTENERNQRIICHLSDELKPHRELKEKSVNKWALGTPIAERNYYRSEVNGEEQASRMLTQPGEVIAFHVNDGPQPQLKVAQRTEKSDIKTVLLTHPERLDDLLLAWEAESIAMDARQPIQPISDISLHLFDKPYFHGRMDGSAASKILRQRGAQPGTFLLRTRSDKPEQNNQPDKVGVLAITFISDNNDLHHEVLKDAEIDRLFKNPKEIIKEIGARFGKTPLIHYVTVGRSLQSFPEESASSQTKPQPGKKYEHSLYSPGAVLTTSRAVR